MSTSSRRFTALSVHDFGGVRVVETQVNDGANIINGDNGSGKSSLIAAIATLLHGKKGAPEVPVREGAERAEIVGHFDDGASVAVTQTAGGTFRLDLRDANGHIIPAPMAVLERIRGAAGVDPVALAWESNPSETILRALGIDVSALDEELKKAEATRLSWGREVRRLEPIVTEAKRKMSLAGGGVTALREVGPLMKEYEQAVASDTREKERARLEKEAEALCQEKAGLQRTAPPPVSAAALAEAKQAVEDATAALAAASKRLADLRLQADEAARVPAQVAVLDKRIAALAEQTYQLGEIVATRPVDEIKAEIDSIGTHNTRYHAFQEVVRAEGSAKLATSNYQEAETIIEELRTRRRAVLRDFGLAIEGLEINEAGNVLYNGRPWMAASAGERLRVAIEVLFASKAQLRIAWTRDGDRLDDHNLAAIVAACEAKGLQLFIERTGVRDSGALVLEAGQAKGVLP